MKQWRGFLLSVTIVIFGVVGTTSALPFYAITNQIGYQGTVTYIPQGETDQIIANTSTPRNAYLYFGGDDSTDYNIFMSNWDEHSPSNVNDSFFQLYDINADTVTSLSGGWNSSHTDFTMTIKGSNAAYTDDPNTNDWSRAWMPDQNTAARGTWTDYTLALTATGMTTEIVDGWIQNVTAPTSITGAFSGTFVSEARTYSWGTTYENTYQVNLALSSALFDQNDFTGTIENSFGAPVPEPSTILLLSAGLIGLVAIGRKRVSHQ